ncbi:MAG: hypothetical protein HQL39_17440, partial [Alphaproteobacteria bacterium]|nr:hypothetical protein [Alphaproteobacteria bacterium]
MSHPLHDHLAGQIARPLRERRVVVWYDPGRLFGAFVDALKAAAQPEGPLWRVPIGGVEARFAVWRGSFLRLRLEVEPLFAVERPEPLLLYLPTARPEPSPLREIEKAGAVFDAHEPKRQARAVLSERLTDSEIDALFETVPDDWERLARLLERPAGQGGVLKDVLSGAAGDEALLAAWLSDPALDR